MALNVSSTPGIAPGQVEARAGRLLGHGKAKLRILSSWEQRIAYLSKALGTAQGNAKGTPLGKALGKALGKVQRPVTSATEDGGPSGARVGQCKHRAAEDIGPHAYRYSF